MMIRLRAVLSFVLAAVLVPAGMGVAASPQAATAEDQAAVKQTMKDFYAAFSSMDRDRYRTLVTDDYLLLESGEILDFAGDVAAMPSPNVHPRRTDSFDFRSVKVEGDVAWTVYVLTSDTVDDRNGARTRSWLESSILRRTGDRWKVALLHSTKITTAR